MPVVQLNLDRLQKLVGKTSNKNKIISKIPFLGLDIEEQTDEYIRVEYSPNRPDYATDFGIALGLQGLFGIKKGIPKLAIKKGDYILKANTSVKKIRPFITSIVAKNGNLNDDILREVISLQEDLHFGIGRRRKKSSIGIHDLDKIVFPITYTTVSKEYRFTPLESSQESTITEILEKTTVGQEYGSILSNTSNFPIILDSKGNTISFPPIINSALTTVTTKTKNLLVEVTATDKKTAEDTIAIVATTLQAAGFSLYSVKISGGSNSTPLLNPKKIILDNTFVNNTLGLNLSTATIVNCLRKCRIDAIAKKNKISCMVPRYRFDIINPMDLVEEVALGYGIENLKPSLQASTSVGQKNSVTQKLDSLRLIMIGLGYTEAINSSLISKQVHNELTNRSDTEVFEVLESKSQEHTILRDSIIPGLLENLSKNVHEQYPQKLFETGIVFSKENPITEKIHLAGISAHKDVSFSEIKSILQSSLKTGFNIDTETKTSSYPVFSEGRTANILVNNKTIGTLGEIDSKVIENFKIRVPLAAFEIQLSGLIFD
jgi:phenylalanyl-tRNA synthetase beta chain